MSKYIALIGRCYKLVRPYGRWKILMLGVAYVCNGLFQVVGTTSVFPFFSLASDPAGFRQSHIGSALLSHLPVMSDAMLLIAAGVLSITLLLLSNIVSIAVEVMRTSYTHNFGDWLRMRLMERIAYRPYRYFTERNNGTLIKVVCSDILIAINSVILPLLDALARMVVISLLVVTVFIANPIVAIGIGVLVSSFYGVTMMLLQKRAVAAGERANKAISGTYLSAQQLFGGIKAVIVHNQRQYFLSIFGKHSSNLAKAYRMLPVYSNGPRYLIEPIAFGGLVATVVIMTIYGKSFMALLPALSVIGLASYRILPNAQLLYTQFSQIAAGMPALREVEQMYNMDGDSVLSTLETQQEAISFTSALRVHNLSFSYAERGKMVLKDLSFTLKKNRSLGIVGESGAGKSTLVDIILGLRTEYSGEVLVDNVVLNCSNINAWRYIVGYVPQDIFLLDDTIQANIVFGCDGGNVSQGRLIDAAKAAQILDLIEDELPDGFSTMVGERGVRLSGGQRQRIGLARALYRRPQVLIMDEATSALDSATENAVVEAIRTLQGHVTIIAIAHRHSTIAHCDERLELKRL